MLRFKKQNCSCVVVAIAKGIGEDFKNLFSFLQVQDMVNKIDDGSGVLDFEDFLMVISIFFLLVTTVFS